jgi:NADH:ubiquinone oxidoreductase subunit E
MSDASVVDPSRIAAVLARYPSRDPGELVNILHDLQAEFRYLSAPAMAAAASYLGLPRAQVYGVATFYRGFHTEPRGEHTCTVCMGTACHVRGAPRLMEQLERDSGVGTGGTTADLALSVEEVSCVGACAIGPLVILDGDVHGHMTADGLSRLLTKLLGKAGRQ